MNTLGKIVTIMIFALIKVRNWLINKTGGKTMQFEKTGSWYTVIKIEKNKYKVSEQNSGWYSFYEINKKELEILITGIPPWKII